MAVSGQTIIPPEIAFLSVRLSYVLYISKLVLFHLESPEKLPWILVAGIVSSGLVFLILSIPNKVFEKNMVTANDDAIIATFFSLKWIITNANSEFINKIKNDINKFPKRDADWIKGVNVDTITPVFAHGNGKIGVISRKYSGNVKRLARKKQSQIFSFFKDSKKIKDNI